MTAPVWVIPVHDSGGHKGIGGSLSPGGDALLTCWDSLAAAAASPVSMEATLVPSRTGLSCLGTDGPTRAAGKKVSLPRVATQHLSALPDLPALPSSAPEAQGQVTFWGRSARAPTSCGVGCPTPAGREGSGRERVRGTRPHSVGCHDRGQGHTGPSQCFSLMRTKAKGQRTPGTLHCPPAGAGAPLNV